MIITRKLIVVQKCGLSCFKVKIYCPHCVKGIQIRSFSWSVFSHIRTKYREIRSISQYLVRMRDNTDQKKLRIWTLHAVP